MIQKTIAIFLTAAYFCNTYVTCMSLKALNPCSNAIDIGPHLYIKEQIIESESDYIWEATFDNEGNLFFISVDWRPDEDDMDYEIGFDQVFVLRKGAETKELIKSVNSPRPFATATDQTGRILVATDQGLYTYDSTRDQIVPYKLSSVYLRDIYAAPDNTLFALKGLTSEQAVTTIRGDKLKPYRKLKSSFNVHIDHDYTLFLGVDNSTFYVKRNNRKIIHEIPVFKNNPANDMAFDSENNVFAVNNEGLWFSHAGSYEFKHLDVLVGVAHAVAIDQEDNFIVGTADGVILFSQVDYCWNQITE